MDEHRVDGAAQVVHEDAQDAQRDGDGDGDLRGHAGLDGDGHGDERGKDAVGRDVTAGSDHAEIDHLDGTAGDEAGLDVASKKAEDGAHDDRGLQGLDPVVASKGGGEPEPQASDKGKQQI